MKDIKQLKNELNDLRQKEPNLRSRSQAQRLGISEAERLSLDMGESVSRLEGDFKELLLRIPEIGQVMALTRNETCVNELTGTYDSVKFKENNHGMGTVVNDKIDLRFFMHNWKYGLAVTMEKPDKTLYSFHFFDENGTAVHKIYTRKDSDIEAYDAIKNEFLAENQEPIRIDEKSNDEEPSGKSNSDFDDADSMQKAWMNLSHTHDFFGMLRKFDISRLTALENAPDGYAVKVENNAVESVLEEVVENKVPIMTFVQSPGCVQIQSGEIQNLRWARGWYNILDPDYNLHLDMDRVQQSWIVRKPTDYGIITSLELYDVDDELAVTFFGERKSGGTERPEWREAVDTILEEKDKHARIEETT